MLANIAQGNGSQRLCENLTSTFSKIDLVLVLKIFYIFIKLIKIK